MTPESRGVTSGGATAQRDERWRLEDEREFLIRSLADAEAEHSAGDLDDIDYAALQRRDRLRLDAVERELAGLELTGIERGIEAGATAGADGATGDPAATEAVRTRAVTPEVLAAARRRTWLAMLGTALVVAGAVLLVAHLTAPQLPGQNIDGGIQLNSAQQVERELDQAATLVDEDSAQSIEQALTIYRQVLAVDPRQPQALAESGYLLWESGFQGGDPKLVTEGRARVVESIRVERDDFAAHLFLGNIDLEDGGAGSAAAAVAQYRLFMVDGPPLSTVQGATPLIRKAYQLAGVPLPGALATTSSTSSTK